MSCPIVKCPWAQVWLANFGIHRSEKNARDFEIEASFKLDCEIAFVERDIVQNRDRGCYKRDYARRVERLTHE
jgi:hypothetical protein